MKHLAGIEPLQLRATVDEKTVTLTGLIPWVSNLRPKQFAVAIADAAIAGSGSSISYSTN
jgi:hypothetical protein